MVIGMIPLIATPIGVALRGQFSSKFLYCYQMNSEVDSIYLLSCTIFLSHFLYNHKHQFDPAECKS